MEKVYLFPLRSEELLSNKIYLLLVIDDNRAIDVRASDPDKGILKRMNVPFEWKLDTHDINTVGIQAISGFKRNEKAAKEWALERCRNAVINQEIDSNASDEIVPFETYLYIDHKCVFVDDTGREEKTVKLKGFKRKSREVPAFGYIELFERPD